MRIIAGAWRGRRLEVPPGDGTRPTADRVRQALFDRLMHADWAKDRAGRAAVEGATVLDAFAGTGALGLEALSRGAAACTFLENAPAALPSLRANVARTEGRGRVLAADALRPPPGQPCTLVFLDPPYGAGLVPGAVAALARANWLAPDALLIAELPSDTTLPGVEPVAHWSHGAAQMVAWRS